MLKFDAKLVEQKIVAVEQYKALYYGLNKFVFATEVLNEFLSNQWTTKSSMVSCITEYNDAITTLRANESSNLQLLQIHPDKSLAAQFAEVMDLVKEIDKSVHGLNDELEKVSIKGTQEKITPEQSTKTAAELAPLIKDLKSRATHLLTLGG